METIPACVGSLGAQDLYIDLLKRVLINHIYQDTTRSWARGSMDAPYVQEEREGGEDHPHAAHTMIGWKRLSNLEQCVRRILADQVPGDLIEAGVWRGGAVIFLRGLLAAFQDGARKVWVADSFTGVPEPDPQIPQDGSSKLHELSYLAVSQESVRENFRRYGLLDDRVVFVPGPFQQSFPRQDFPVFSLVRLDADLYESTRTGLEYLYPRLAPGGFIIIDDYYAFSCCREATDEYRKIHGIAEPVLRIDNYAAYWRKHSLNDYSGDMNREHDEGE